MASLGTSSIATTGHDCTDAPRRPTELGITSGLAEDLRCTAAEHDRVKVTKPPALREIAHRGRRRSGKLLFGPSRA